jgi:hypothetical protein
LLYSALPVAAVADPFDRAVVSTGLFVQAAVSGFQSASDRIDLEYVAHHDELRAPRASAFGYEVIVR